MTDPALIARVDAMPATPYSGEAFRHRQTVADEFRRLASRSERAPEDFLPRALYRYDIGDAAWRAGREGVLAPSAAGGGVVLAVFVDDLADGSHVNAERLEVWQELGEEGAG